MYKLINISDSEAMKDIKYLSAPFHFNEMPKPYKKISMGEYLRIVDNYLPEYEGTGQICRPADYYDLTESKENLHSSTAFVSNAPLSAYYKFYGSFGLARIKFYDKEKGEYCKVYKFGCEHEWEVISADSISYVRKCNKCGCVEEVPTGK
jgi:hypothetical protein